MFHAARNASRSGNLVSVECASSAVFERVVVSLVRNMPRNICWSARRSCGLKVPRIRNRILSKFLPLLVLLHLVSTSLTKMLMKHSFSLTWLLPPYCPSAANFVNPAHPLVGLHHL